MQNMLKWLGLAFVVLVLDLWTKHLASSQLSLYQSIEVIPGFFNITLAHNKGAAFSFLAQESGWQRWLFAGIAIVVSVAITIWLTKLKSHERFMAVSLALVLGGALGNLWDRVTLGYVVDFIDIYYQSYHWPAFNIADSAITVGAVMLVWDAFKNSTNE